MKKILFVLICLFSLNSLLLAEERNFNKRIFDITIDSPLDISNNVINMKDIFQPVVLIDLTKIADEMSEDGFCVLVNSKPKISFGIDFPEGLILKLNTGLDLYGYASIGKPLFDFLGKGNNLNEDLEISVGGYADAFVYFGLDVGFNFPKFTLIVSPSLYAAIAHCSMENSKIVVSNSSSGDFSYDMNCGAVVYSDYIDYWNNPKGILDYLRTDYSSVLKNTGFDLAAYLTFDPFRYLSVGISANVPIYPCKISKKTAINVSSSFSTSLSSLTSGGFTKPTFAIDKSGKTDASIKINRPLKLFVSGNFHPFNGVMDYYAGLGFGVEHPFADEGISSDFYFDYLLGLRLSLWNILNINLSTARTDKIFIHTAQVGLNVRVIEIKAGVSAESSDFVQSLKGAGLGIFVQASVGF